MTTVPNSSGPLPVGGAPRTGLRVQAASTIRSAAEAGAAATVSSLGLLVAGTLAAIFPSAPSHVSRRALREP